MFKTLLKISLTLSLLITSACTQVGTPTEDHVFSSDAYKVYPDSIIVFSDSLKAVAISPIEISFSGTTAVNDWKEDSVTRQLPVYASDQTLIDALYNRGARTIAEGYTSLRVPHSRYAIEMTLALTAPEKAMEMLEKQITGGRIANLSGAGGGWPVVADRASWITAAWEVYKTTGSRQWLSKAYNAAKLTLADDIYALQEPAYGLMHGIPMPLDSRPMFPYWMEGSDLYSTMCLTTNVNFAAAYGAMSMMADELGENPGEYMTLKRDLTTAINERLWIPDAGYYSQYLYGAPYPILSQATDNLGQALCVVHGLARNDWAAALITKTPRYPGWLPRVYPQMPDTSGSVIQAAPPVPEVLAYWTRATAITQPGPALDMAIGSQLACLATAPPDNQLRHAIGLASTIYRVIAGISTDQSCMHFAPVVPASMKGTKWLSGVRYRNSTLDIVIHGTGHRIRKFTVDGKESHAYSVKATLEGSHKIEITLDDVIESYTSPRTVQPISQPVIPVLDWPTPRKAEIMNLTKGISYRIFLNNDFSEQITDSTYQLYEARNFTTVYVVPFDNKNNISGYSPRPHHYFPPTTCFGINATRLTTPGTELLDKKDEDYGNHVIELTPAKNCSLKFDVVVSIPGNYFIDVRYTNGSGPRLSGKKCALRTLSVNGIRAGVLVMAQQGNGHWTKPTFSNPVEVRFNGGRNTVAIEYIEPYNVNTDGLENNALIEYVRFVRR